MTDKLITDKVIENLLYFINSDRVYMKIGNIYITKEEANELISDFNKSVIYSNLGEKVPLSLKLIYQMIKNS